MTVVDLFAGPGGWDLAARELGLDPVGIERERDALATREAAGLRTLQADVAVLDPTGFGPLEGLIASPPCQAWSVAGKRRGRVDLALVERVTDALARGRDLRAEAAPRLADARSLLVVEPLRWALTLRPRWIALEQVPPVLDYWRRIAVILEAEGWRCWAGVANAADYGVPQTRRRAILLAHRERRVGPPEPSHGDPRRGVPMFGLPWVSMAQALGWGEGGPTYLNGTRERRTERPATEPAPTLHFGERLNDVRWRLAGNEQENAAVRALDEPAPTLLAGNNGGPRWRVGFPRRPENADGLRGGELALRVTLAEAAILQGFPPEHPFQGSRTSQFRQVGNAIPPPFARRLLEQVARPPETERTR